MPGTCGREAWDERSSHIRRLQRVRVEFLKAVENNPLDAGARVIQIYMFSGSSKVRWFTIRRVSRSLVAHSEISSLYKGG
jgi:hypothetical protein